MSGRGFNTFHGPDNGPLPPGLQPSQPAGLQPFPPACGWPAQPAALGWPAQPVGWPAQAPMPGYPYPYPHPAFPHPAMPPRENPNFPTIHLRNHTNGIGLEPGYDYAFPSAHTKIHVFTTKEKPWQNAAPLHNWDASKHVKLYVPSNTTIKELMQNLGANNKDAGKNVLHELTEQGGGKWVKGLTIKGDDKDRVKKAISEFGWDKTRTGKPGERPVVWLYVTKD